MRLKRHFIWTLAAFALFCTVSLALQQQAWASIEKVAEIQPIIIVGDRAVDIAWNLGVLPKAMSARCSLWSACPKLKTASQLLGCPNRIVAKKPDALPKAIAEYSIKRVIFERSPEFCLYKPKVSPLNAVDLAQGLDVDIEYLDFAEGVVPAIRQMAALLGKEAAGEQLAETYQKSLQRMEKNMPAAPLQQKVVIFNGVYQQSTGKVFIRVEAPGGYSDRYMLEPLGCANKGDGLIADPSKVKKGHATIRSAKALVEIQPDVIVMTGNAYAVQRFLAEEIAKNPELQNVPAIKQGRVFSLPLYVDSSVIEYPTIFAQWQQALEP